MEGQPTQPGLKTRIKKGLAQQGMRALDATLENGIDAINVVRAMVDDVFEPRFDQPETPVSRALSLARDTGKSILRQGINTAKTVGLIDVVNLHRLPRLLEDENADTALKRRFIRDLVSGMADALPLDQEMSRFAQVSFLRGIPPENLIDFLQSRKVLDLIISRLLGLSDSSGSVLEYGHRLLTTARASLENVVTSIDKPPIPPDLEAALIQDLQHFKEKYDPRDKKCTIYRFVQTLKTRPAVKEGEIPPTDYSEYDISTWLKNHRRLLAQILHEPDGNGRPKKRHISNIIDGAYEEEGKADPDQFIAIYLPRIMALECLSDHPKQYAMRLELYELANFFNDVVPRIQTKENGPVELRARLIVQCNKEISKHPECTTLLTMDARPVRQDGERINDYKHANQQDMMVQLSELIRTETKILPAPFEIGVDPEEVSAQVQTDYLTFFDGDDSLHSAYYEHLRSMLELQVEDAIRAEPFPKIRKRLARIYQLTDQCLNTLDAKLGLQCRRFPTVTDVHEKAELIRTAYKAPSKEERFAARIKLELANRIYEIAYSQLYVSRAHNAAQMKLRLEQSKGGVALNSTSERTVIHFLDHPDGLIEEVSTPDDHQGNPNLKKVSLIPATFGNIPCHLLPPREHDPEVEAANDNYISTKSIFSLVMKALRKRLSAKEITDYLRMTFVVDTPDDLRNMQEHLENNYLSFGKVLKRENRYNELVDVATLNVDKNEFKSEQYQCLRYVLDIPIPSDVPGQEFYLVPIEIRILLKEDLLKEESLSNPASAQKYQVRKTTECARILRPQVIHPDLYEKQEPDQHDRFRDESVYKFKLSLATASDHIKQNKALSSAPTF